MLLLTRTKLRGLGWSRSENGTSVDRIEEEEGKEEEEKEEKECLKKEKKNHFKRFPLPPPTSADQRGVRITLHKKKSSTRLGR